MSAPVLKASWEWYPGDNYEAIASVRIVDTYSEDLLPSGVTVTQSWPADVDESGAITCYELSDLTLILAGNGSGNIMANADSSAFCSGFTSLVEIIGLELLDTSDVTTMQQMFSNCPALISLELRNFDTTNVFSMETMFKGCSALKVLDLSSFDTSNVTTINTMFGSCSSLTTVLASDRWTSNYSNSAGVFTGCTNLVGGNGTVYNSRHASAEYACIDTPETPGYFTYKKYYPFGEDIAFAVYSADDTSLTFYKRDTVPAAGDTFEGKSVTAVYEGIETTEYGAAAGSPPWVSLATQVTKAVVVDRICPISIGGWFGQMSALQTVDLSKLDTSMVTSMSGTFANCSSLKSLDLCGFDTSKVTDMSMMFGGCTMPALDLSSFDTSNVTNLAYMFMMANIGTIQVSERWTVSNVTFSTYMFLNCTGLVGGNGTVCAGGYSDDATYARIDKPGEPGYFTYKKYYPPETRKEYLIQGATWYDIAESVRGLVGRTEPMSTAKVIETLSNIKHAEEVSF